MSVRAMVCSLAAVLLTVALAVPAAAQTLYGSLTGNVTDASGAAVPNAKVEALNVGTGIVKTAQTDERGAYLFNDLQPGHYKVTISAPAFSTRVVEGVDDRAEHDPAPRCHVVGFASAGKRHGQRRDRSRCRPTAPTSTT